MPALAVNGNLLLFIHVPKTGGSSVEAVLAEHGPLILANGPKTRDLPCSPTHFHAPLLAQVLPTANIGYSCMLVRHPLDRIASEYRYTTRKPRRWQGLMSFRTWLRFAAAARAADPYYRDNHLRPQNEFALPGTEVFRFEDGIGRCVAAMLSRLGETGPVSIPHLKESDEAPLKISRRDAEFVHWLYAADYTAYGYDTWPESWGAETVEG